MKIYAQARKDTVGISEELKENIFNTVNNAPLIFTENRGQIDASVKYYVKGSGYTFYFTPNEIKYSFIQKKSMTEESESTDHHLSHEKDAFSRVTVAQEFIGANTRAKIEARDKRSETVNYFKGNDPAKWKTQVPVYEKIIYRELWRGIDLAIHGENGGLKCEFIVQPGACVDDIQFVYKDMYETFIDEKGNLIVKTPLGDLIDEKPICYQQINGEKVIIESNFTVRGQSPARYGYNTGDYDTDYPLVIDPGIMYSSYLGGDSVNGGTGIAVDQFSNVYVIGYTGATDFPVVNAFQPSIAGGSDAFITKIDATPSIVYSSYLGGSSFDRGYGITVDQNGNAYVIGRTQSSDFPTINAFQSSLAGDYDAFVAMIDSSPSIVYSSYLGGSSQDEGYGIAVDQNGNAYVTGYTESADFPVLDPFQSYGGGKDAFVTKIDATPAIVYSSYLGGTSNEYGCGIAVDSYGNAYLEGATDSIDFPVVNAFQPSLAGSTDAFITKIDATPSIVYSSYLGGASFDRGYGIAVDQKGNAYIAGFTDSMDFPVVNAFQPSLAGSTDAFITKIDATPSIVYSSYLGGYFFDYGIGIAVDQNENAYVTGITISADFPVVNAFQPSIAGNTDAFITKIDPTPSIVYSSYLGGSDLDQGSGIAVDQNGNAYVTGYTHSTDFPVVFAFQPSKAGWDDAFVTKVGGPLSLQITAANLTAVVYD